MAAVVPGIWIGSVGQRPFDGIKIIGLDSLQQNVVLISGVSCGQYPRETHGSNDAPERWASSDVAKSI
jgi:hypothetical protein